MSFGLNPESESSFAAIPAATAVGGLGGAAAATGFGLLSAFGVPTPVSLLEGALAGRPRMLDTQQAAARLGQSHNPAVRALGAEIARISRETGQPLSTGHTGARNAYGQAFGAAVQRLVYQGIPAHRAERQLEAIISSHSAASGASIPPQASNARIVNPRPSQAPRPSLFSTGLLPAATQFAVNPPLPPSLPPIAQITPPGKLIAVGREFGQYFHDLSDRTVRAITGQGGEPTQQIPPLQPQPEIAPLLDTTKPCPGCDRIPALQRQERAVEREIQREQQQQTDKTIEQQQQQIDYYAEQEQRDPQQRDIEQELRGKQNLLTEIQNEIEELKNFRPIGPQQPQQGGPVTHPTGSPVPTLQDNPQQAAQQDRQAAQQLEQHAQELEQQTAPTPKIQFCVGCASNEDAILFLNGEPAQCSVIPGTTQTIGGSNG